MLFVFLCPKVALMATFFYFVYKRRIAAVGMNLLGILQRMSGMLSITVSDGNSFKIYSRSICCTFMLLYNVVLIAGFFRKQ